MKTKMTQVKVTQLFKSPSLSIARANKHIQDLENSINAYNKDYPCKLVKKYSKDRSEYLVVSRITKPLPDNLESIATDAIYNLRASLDQMMYAVAKISESCSNNFEINYNRIAFPIIQDKRSVEKKVEIYLSKGLHRGFSDILLKLKPWEHEEENSLFYWLNEAANVNKHKFLTAVQLRTGAFSGRHISGPKTLVGPSIKEFRFGGARSNIEVNHPTIKPAGNEIALYSGITKKPTKYEIEIEIDVKFKNICGIENYSSVAILKEISEECERAMSFFMATTGTISC